MEKNLMRWLKIFVLLEVLAVAVLALLVVFDVMTFEGAQSDLMQVTLGIVVLSVAGAVIGALLARPDAGAPKS